MAFAVSPEPAGASQASNWLHLLARIAAHLSQYERSLRFIDGVFAELSEPLGLDAYLYYQADKDQRTLSLLAYRGIDEAAAEQHDVLHTSALTPESVCIWPADAEALADDSQRLPNLSAALDLPAGVHLPLVSAGHCLGSLLVGRREPFSHEELDLLQTVGCLVAAALDRGRLRYQLQTEHARFQGLLDHIPAAVLLAEASSGRIVLGNPQAERILGRPVASDSSDGGSEPAPAELLLLRALSGEDVQAIDYLFKRGDGTQTWLRASGSPIRDPHGRVIGSLITCYDIDERIRMQQELERADRSKDEFLAVLGHELRNPLSAISYSVSLLEMDAHDSQSRQPLELIRRQLSQISRLIEDLLDLSRVKQGKIAIQKRLVNLNDVVDRALEAARPVFQQRKHILQVSQETAPLMLQADPVRLEQVIVNLLNNAAKYTESGGQISVTTQRSGEHAVLTVRDNGIGMSGETLASIFELYTQDRAARERSQGGLGIGLALVEALVKLHDGTVSAHSEGLGRGSEFAVHLPLVQGIEPPLPRNP